MSDIHSPARRPHFSLDLLLSPLRKWSLSDSCQRDLESVFGLGLDWSSAHPLLQGFREGDFSKIPQIDVIPQFQMPGLLGGYSREDRRIFVSEECPPHLLQEIVLEEIGHFLDQEICSHETPGDEGALFACAVLGKSPSLPQRSDWAAENERKPVYLGERTVLVEAAPKVRGDGDPKIRPGDITGDTRITEDGSAVIAIKDSVRIVQAPNKPIRRLIGSKGNDTFVVNDDKVRIRNSSGRTELVDLRIEDPRGGTDTIETKVSLSLEKFLPIEHLRAASGASSLSLTGNSKANTITGNSGNNTLDGRGGRDTLIGGAGNDILSGGLNDGVADSLIGGAGNDTYYVENLQDVIVEAAGGGTDTIVTSNRNITRLTFRNIEKVVYTGAPGGGGGAGGISTVGTPFDDFLFGDDKANNFSGLAGNDTLDAKGGNDSLDGGSGNDSMIGGAGNDTYIVDSALDVVVEAANAGTDLVISSVSHTLGNHVENLRLNASLAVADANINGTGNSLANIITGNSGNNQLDGGGGADTIRGGAGNDILNGGTADGVGDLLEGGEGSDRYIVDSTLDVIRDSGGTDTVETSVSFNIGDTLKVEGIEHLLYKGNNAAATLRGNNGDNSLTSEGAGADTLFGGAGNDTLNGGAGANSLVGGAGDDYYIVNSSLESGRIYEETAGGLDTVLTRVATFSLGANSNVEILFYDPLGTSKTNLTGSNSDNTITGGNFGNTLSGLGGNDYLIGGVQGDMLIGGAGNDTMDGKAGVNTLVGGAGDDYYFTDSQSVNIVENSGEGTDTIRSSVTFSLEDSNKLANVENLYLTGATNLTGTGNALNNTITGNDGANVLSGKLGNDIILGGFGADHIKGDEGDDSLVGGGDLQGDVPADASTPIILQTGQTYTGQINSRNETDWIRVDLLVGVTYTFAIDSQLVGAPVLNDRSDVAFGVQGSDQYWPTWQDGNLGYQPPLIGDLTPSNALLNGQPWVGHLTDHDELVLNSDGTAAYGYTDPKSLTKSSKFSNNIIGFQFTPFESGTFFIPVSGAGPAVGSYRITLTDPENPVTGIPAHADNASNTLIGGLGKDTLVSGKGRDTLGNAIGDILLGGTNGLLGQADTDSSDDTLIGGDGNDSLDGGNGANSLIGGKGDDFYFIRSASDVIVEKTDGGNGDAMIVNFAAKLGGEWDIVLDPDYVPTGPVFQYANIENVTLTGLANTSVLGSPNSDKIVGNFGNNTFDGGVGDDSLFGGGGRDLLIGGEGADYLDGGIGINTLDGGFGADTYVVNDRDDRIINEAAGFDGGEDHVLTYFNFDPIQGLGVHPVTGEVIFDYQPDFADNSPSITKSQSFASKDLDSFYNLENFELLGQAAYGVGNALNNSITAGATGALLLGMGGQDTLLGGAGNDTLHGDDPEFYAIPDIYAAAPQDTIVKEFLLRVIGRDADNGYEYTAPGLDYLSGGAGDDYIDGGRGFDIMIGGEGNDTFVQDNVDDYIVATVESGSRGINELISSVDVNQVPDGVSKLMLVVANQAEGSGQTEVAKIGSFRDSKLGNDRTVNVTIGASVFTTTQANHLEVMYAPRAGEAFTPNQGDLEDDLLNPGKMQVDLSWVAGPDAATSVVGYTVRYRRLDDPDDIWHTYIRGRSQDFEGTRENPSLIVRGLENADYEFEVRAVELAIPALKSGTATPVTLLGGLGNDAVIGDRLTRGLPGPMNSNFTIEFNDAFTDPLVWNNPIAPLPPGFIFNPLPSGNVVQSAPRFATYLDGGAGNDFLSGTRVNGGLGEDYIYKGVEFKGLNTMVGGQGSDTFVVSNGGLSVGDEFDWIVKYGNETPVNYGQGGSGESLNGGQHNLVVSGVPFLVLSDTLVHQGKFIDRINLPGALQFAMGNRLDNYIYETSLAISSFSTLVGNTGRDSITSSRKGNLLIGGTNYGTDDVGLAVKDFAAVENGGYGLTNSIFRDFDPVPASAGTIGISDPAQFWFVPGYYGDVFDPFRNRDTLVAGAVNTTLDGGAGSDSLVGSGPGDDDDKAAKRGDMFIVSQGAGSTRTIVTHDIRGGDAVIGNGGNDTVTFTDSDYLWWGTPIAGGANRTPHTEGAVLLMNGYTIASDISNLVLQAGAATARNATGNKTSTANDHDGWFSEIGSNRIIGNEFDNILDGGGVGSEEQNVGGFDTLTGGGGSDLFVIDGYTDATNNRWNPEYDGDTGRWRRDDSTYTDADFARINDFTEEDFINLVGGGLNLFAIGRAPGYIGENNLKQPDAAPTATEFGIFRRSNGNGNPDLVAHVILAGGLTLDLNNLGTEFRPAADGSRGVFYDIATSQFLQVDRLTPISGADFFITRQIYSTTVQTASTASLASLVNSGNNTLLGGNQADFIDGSFGNDSIVGGGGHDTLIGGPGKDTLLGEAGDDSLVGDRDSDSLIGGNGDDILDAGNGADTLDGGAGDDLMFGGEGDDVYYVDSLSDIVVEDPSAGTDWVFSSISGYTLTGTDVENLVLTGSAIDGSGNTLDNSLIGNTLNNSLTGLGGDDTFDGGAGIDTFEGDTGNDLYIVDTATDTILDLGGTDTVLSSVSFDLANALVNGGTGIEHLVYTGTLNATLAGNTLANSISGGVANDLLSGGGGNDTLTGTSGTGASEIDTLSGGAGADLFVLANSSNLFYNSAAGVGDYALITDFNVGDGDMLQLRNGLTYLFSSTNPSSGAIGAANSYLYRDDGNGTVGSEDNLIAAITATGGALTTSDLGSMARYV